MERDRWLSEAARNVPPYGIMEIARLARKVDQKDLVYLNIGEPDFDTPENIRSAAVRAIEEGKTHYTTDIGIQELREAISLKLVKGGINYTPEDVTIVSGTQEGISVLSQTILDPGDEVIISDPYYPSYTQNILLRRGVPKYVPLSRENEFIMTAGEVRKQVTPKTKAIVLVSPSNPTGSVIPEAELREIAEIAKENDLLVISDEIYTDIVYDGIKPRSIAGYPGMNERTVVQSGFSKAYAMTGWRMGYVATPPAITQKFQEIHRATVICPPSISQYAALEAITGPQESVQRMVQEFARRREFVMKRLAEIPDLPVHKPKGAFYVFPDFSAYTKDDQVLAKDLIIHARVVAVHGTTFGERGKGHLRISFAASMEKLEEGLNRIDAYLRILRASKK
jgi:aminotransferase